MGPRGHLTPESTLLLAALHHLHVDQPSKESYEIGTVNAPILQIGKLTPGGIKGWGLHWAILNLPSSACPHASQLCPWSWKHMYIPLPDHPHHFILITLHFREAQNQFHHLFIYL